MATRTTFLTAEWRHLVMLNYEVDPALLAGRVPGGTELDTHDGKHWISAVGFLFLDTLLLGVPVPFHRDFEELNLRFYVRRNVPDVERGLPYRRGVVFIKELVPRAAIATVARLMYNEPYEARAMRHEIARIDAGRGGADGLGVGDRVTYGFEHADGADWGQLGATVAGAATSLVPGSHAEFIAEHYWGYTPQTDGSTAEYEVRHPPWQVHQANAPRFDGDLEVLYGEGFAGVLSRPPYSVFIAVGSSVTVMGGERL